MGGPDAVVLRWVAGVLGCGAVTAVRGLREGGPPWLLEAGGREVVPRVGQPGDAPSFATEVAALSLAVGAGVPAPKLLGHDSGPAVGVPVVLTERLPGTSCIPRQPDQLRLFALVLQPDFVTLRCRGTGRGAATV
jgi:hypothetical protein